MGEFPGDSFDDSNDDDEDRGCCNASSRSFVLFLRLAHLRTISHSNYLAATLTHPHYGLVGIFLVNARTPRDTLTIHGPTRRHCRPACQVVVRCDDDDYYHCDGDNRTPGSGNFVKPLATRSRSRCSRDALLPDR